MSPKKGCIAVVPVGNVPEAALRTVVAQILVHFNLPADILSPLENPEYAFDMRRRQYNAATIIKTFESMPFREYGKVLAILNVDIFIPISPMSWGRLKKEEDMRWPPCSGCEKDRMDIARPCLTSWKD